MPLSSDIQVIKVGARASPLSKAQVLEVWNEIREHLPQVVFEPVFVETYGDKDRITSLREMGKTDFFTREVDQLLLSGKCRICIHSAKDLPDPLPSGIRLIALTKGLTTVDALVLRPGLTLETLPANSLIGTSSIRREELLNQLGKKLTFIDLRGTIEERLAKLKTGEADGVVIAEAALIRLGLTDLNRIILNGETAPFQGKLAIVALENDHEIIEYFKVLQQ